MQENSPNKSFELFTQTKIDINEYAKEEALEPIKFNTNTSTIRTVWAVGTLEKPYYVKVRNNDEKYNLYLRNLND